MSINHLIYRNLKKNIKNYYLYVFALVFSVALYFAFVTLQYDPSMDKVEGSIKGAAAIQAGSVLLVAIVAVFIFYANNIFIKRRSKEIGLFQLIGMTKGKIFRILSVENACLYFGSLVIGIFIGFSVSKLIVMILFRITGVEAVTTLRFSTEALVQTLLVFAGIYLFIMLLNYIFIKKQSILVLFQVKSSTETKVKKMSLWQMIIGILGIGLIIFGYCVSTKLFSGEFSMMTELSAAILFILGSVIIGTYLFYKGSVSFIFYLIRKRKDGYLNLNDVLSLSSLMFRMKSNALLLTVITTISALAIGLLSLTYITYYSAEKSAEQYVPSHFSMINTEDAEQFTSALEENQIPHSETRIDVIQVETDISQIMESNVDDPALQYDPSIMQLSVVSEEAVGAFDVSPKETYFAGYSQVMQQMMSLNESGQIVMEGENESIPQNYLGLRDDSILPIYFTAGGLPVAVVDNTIFQRLAQDIDPDIQRESSIYIGLDMKDRSDMEQANEIFQDMTFNANANSSQLGTSNSQKMNMGLIMFIVGFLGLAFLITSGCILYFKQMDEGEEEKGSYTILRKLGFTRGDILRGIQMKQLFNFGIPLVIGLLHSYFAVKSGWFLFGTELWTPMILVMLVYTGLYSIFGILSVIYYKRLIKEAL
ncbi:ABC transporter permease [Virgibacillus sp. NKC19-16]|uniref:ABC transporter permease n=1 Tax=Virgibacillus salidurans TaxID=2831673 RepID=UPI001F4728C3|nr:ABC transporter permease [Virgibacillus sp. NKC19-16]UJL46728.1 ABC transporter permease [Virgibacillus sp. NKC19-16]